MGNQLSSAFSYASCRSAASRTGEAHHSNCLCDLVATKQACIA